MPTFYRSGNQWKEIGGAVGPAGPQGPPGPSGFWKKEPSGAISTTSDVKIAGVLTYEDVTNVDAVGLITARTGLHVLTGAGVSIVAGGLNVTAGVSTFGGNVEFNAGLIDINGDTGSPGQVLQSTGSGLDWVDPTTGTVNDVKQYHQGTTERTCSEPIWISANGETIGIGSTSNAYGNKWQQAADPTTPAGGGHTVCDGDMWYAPGSAPAGPPGPAGPQGNKAQPLTPRTTGYK